MRIMFVINSLQVGGAERSTVNLANFLSSLGNQVTITTFGVPVADDFSLLPRVNRVHVHGFLLRNRFVRLIDNFYLVFQLSRLIRAASSHRCDVIIGVMTTASVLAILAARFIGVKVITNETTFPGRAERGFYWRLLRALVYRFADAHVVSTETTARWMREELNLSRVSVIPNAISCIDYSGLPSYSPKIYHLDSQDFVLAVGSRFHTKGFDFLLNSCVIVRKECPSLRLVVLGLRSGGQEWSLFREHAKSLGLGDSVVTPGIVGNMAEWYVAAKCFVLTSRYEGFANVLLEAMFHGCPPVSFNCEAGPNEIISHEVDGILVDFGDERALARAIISLEENHKLRDRLGAAGLVKARNFSQEACCEQWLQLFSRVTHCA